MLYGYQMIGLHFAFPAQRVLERRSGSQLHELRFLRTFLERNGSQLDALHLSVVWLSDDWLTVCFAFPAYVGMEKDIECFLSWVWLYCLPLC